MFIIIFLEKRVPGWVLEQRESCMTVLYLWIIIISNSYIIIKLLFNLKKKNPQPKPETELTPLSLLFWLGGTPVLWASPSVPSFLGC